MRLLTDDDEVLLCLSGYHSNAYALSGSVSVTPIRAIRFGYDCRYTLLQSVSGDYDHSIRALDQHATLDASLVRDRLTMSVTARHTHNNDLRGRKDYAFMDCAVTGKLKSKMEIVLEAKNLFNTNTFVAQSESDMINYFETYHLRPRSIMLKWRLNL